MPAPVVGHLLTGKDQLARGNWIMSTIATYRSWTFDLPAEFGHRDVTAQVQDFVTESNVETGITSVQLVGSTGAVTTIEYESGALADLRRALDRAVPADGHYEHNARWGDGNGFSHVRSAMLKTSIVVPVINGRLNLGTWQQIVIINLDNRSRARKMTAVVVGV